MSVFVFGPRDHAPGCNPPAEQPPVLCGCRSLDPACAPVIRPYVHGPRIGRALNRFFHPIDRNAA